MRRRADSKAPPTFGMYPSLRAILRICAAVLGAMPGWSRSARETAILLQWAARATSSRVTREVSRPVCLSDWANASGMKPTRLACFRTRARVRADTPGSPRNALETEETLSFRVAARSTSRALGMVKSIVRVKNKENAKVSSALRFIRVGRTCSVT